MTVDTEPLLGSSKRCVVAIRATAPIHQLAARASQCSCCLGSADAILHPAPPQLCLSKPQNIKHASVHIVHVKTAYMLTKPRRMQKESGEAASPVAIRRAGSLARRSTGTSAEPLLSPSTSMPRSFTREWAPMSPQNMRALARSETVAAGRAGSHAGSSPAHLQRMCSMPLTRGELCPGLEAEGT